MLADKFNSITVILCVLCTIIPILEFAGFHNRKNADTMLSMPISRAKLVLVHFLNGAWQIVTLLTFYVSIYVGVLMLMGLKNIEWDDMDQVVPVAIMLIGMPVSGSIGHAIGLALISYTFIKLFSGKAKEVSLLTYIISGLFLVKFFLVV